MAGSAPMEETPKLGRAATITGFLFVVLILTGFSAATAVSYEDSVSHDHDEEYADDGHGEDDHAEDDHGEDDHAEDGDDHGDE